MSRIRVMIVDDHEMVRKGLIHFLEMSDGIEICGEAASGEECLQKLEREQPDVLLLDLSMPGMGGAKAAEEVRKRWPAVKVIILTSFAEEEMVVRALQAGAHSYLLKTCSPGRLESSIHSVMKGQSIVDPAVTHILIGQMNKPSTQTPAEAESITPREREVLYCIAQGMSNKEIAAQLFIGIKTVKTHVSNLLEKLELSDRTQLAIYAHQTGLHKK